MSDEPSQLELELSCIRQLLRQAYEQIHQHQQLVYYSNQLLEEKNRQLFLSEVKVQEYQEQARRAEQFLLDLGFKKRDDGVWVCQTPPHASRQIETSLPS